MAQAPLPSNPVLPDRTPVEGPSTGPRRTLRLLVPLLWGAGNLLGYEFRGDEYGFYLAGSLPGLFVLPLVEELTRGLARAAVLVAGGAVLFAAGYALDRLRFRTGLWALLAGLTAALVTASLLGGFEDLEQARQKNGPILGYAVVGATVGTYLATGLALGLGIAWRLLRGLLGRAGGAGSGRA